MVIKIENGLPVGHPITESNFRNVIGSDVSLPTIITQEVANENGYSLYVSIDPGTPVEYNTYTEDGYEVNPDGTVSTKYALTPMFTTEAELLTYKKAIILQAVNEHTHGVVSALGYDNINSIAKYLVVGNPFYEECKSISLWVAALWVRVNEYNNGTVQYTTLQAMLDDLPIYSV